MLASTADSGSERAAPGLLLSATAVDVGVKVGGAAGVGFANAGTTAGVGFDANADTADGADSGARAAAAADSGAAGALTAG